MEFIFWAVVVALGLSWLGVVLVGPPYVPTLARDLEELFKAISIRKEDRFVDLGAGDGRVLVWAAKKGALVSGVEINPFLYLLARIRLRKYKADLKFGDMWQYELPKETRYVFVFVAGKFMNKLKSYCEARARVSGSFELICYGFSFADKQPERIIGAFNLYKF